MVWITERQLRAYQVWRFNQVQALIQPHQFIPVFVPTRDIGPKTDNNLEQVERVEQNDVWKQNIVNKAVNPVKAQEEFA